MQKLLIIFFVSAGLGYNQVQAQTHEITQLILNYEKLEQLEEILDQMYKGYKVLTQGYNTIKDIAEGNFNLHSIFLDKLYQVSPLVRDYHKVKGIIRYQGMIVKNYQQVHNRLEEDPNLSPSELEYIKQVYTRLLEQSLKNLDELIMVITAAQVRMSDDERLEAIDHIYANMEDKLAFLHTFNHRAQLLLVQRARERNDMTTLQKLYLVK